MALLRFLFITICILWLIRFVFRLLLPILFQKLVNKMQGQQYAQQQYQRQYHTRNTEGKIKVDYIPPKAKEARAADKAGDFIDFEEVKK